MIRTTRVRGILVGGGINGVTSSCEKSPQRHLCEVMENYSSLMLTNLGQRFFVLYVERREDCIVKK